MNSAIHDRRVTSRATLFFSILTIVVLSFLVGLFSVMLAQLVEITRLLIWVLLLILFMLSIFFLNRDEPASLWNIVCACGLVAVVSIVVMVVISGLTWMGMDYSVNAEIVTAKVLMLWVLSLICGRIGYRWGNSLADRKPVSRPLMNLQFHHRVYTRIAFFLLIPVGIVSQLLIIGRLGGLQAVLTSLVNRSFSGTSMRGLGFVELFVNLAIGGVILLLFLAKTRWSWRFGVVVAFVVVVAYVWAGRRTVILPIFLAIVFSYHHKIRRIKFRYWVLLAAVGYVIMSAILLGRLYASGSYARSLSSDPLGFFTERLKLGIGGTMDGFFQVVAKEDGFGVRPWSYEAWYSFLWYPIPRALFPGKPLYIPIGRLVKGFYVTPYPGFDFESGVAPTVLTTLYLNAGYVGIMFGMIILAGLLGISDGHLLKRGRPESGILHLVVWMLVFILFRTGDLTAAVSQSIDLFGGFFMTLIAVSFFGISLKNTSSSSAVPLAHDV